MSVESGLFAPQPRQLVIHDVLERVRAGLDPLPDAELATLLEDALYHERKRLDGHAPADAPHRERLDRLARALVRGDRRDRTDAALEVVAAWADEIHGRFDPKMYRFATRVLPRGLTGLLSKRPDRLSELDLSANARIKVTGDLALLRDLAREATLILAPTHLSNLDSPLIGLALYQAGLPPFVYGAGLNLFSNPVMGFFMRRLGAYTVDRTKRAQLYKEVLKQYSVRCLVTRHHSLFFPGGTRSRSGLVETRLKKGLLGTGLTAWQEMIRAGRPDAEVYVIPLTLSSQLVLEAASLIDDHLADAGKQRYIITDDEFARPKEVAGFFRRVLDLDASVVAHFGAPIDVLGNPVPADATARREAAIRRRRFVCNRDGEVEPDEQRDHLYTERLAEALVRAYPVGASIMATHLAAWVGWRSLEIRSGSRDPFRVIRAPYEARVIPRATFVERLTLALGQVIDGARAGRWQTDLPASPIAVLDQALDRFGRYHKTRALRAEGDDVVVEDPKLALYYANRVVFAQLDVGAS
jgi:glycerol-3-phosphate O-acyltransferase